MEDSNSTAEPVKEVLLETLFQFASPFVIYSLVLVNLVNHLLYHRRLRGAVNSLWDIYRTLDSKPQVLKILLILVTALSWPVPLIIYISQEYSQGTVLLLIFTDFQICFFACLVEDAFRVLKVKVKELHKLLVQTSEAGGFLLYFDEPCTKLGSGQAVDLFKLRQVHRQLYEVMTTVNQAYNISALVTITIKRFYFTLFIYRWITSGFHSLEVSYSLFDIHWILYLCYRFEALKTVEKETVNMINGLDKSPLDTKTRAEFKLYVVQIRSLQMVISPIQMFNLDFTLITSMFSSTITYLMLLQQFN